MGMRRRTRRRALVAGAAVGAAAAHHRAQQSAAAQPEDDVQPEPDGDQEQAQYTPAPPDQADQLEHLAQLHSSGALTDEEFAQAKANALGS
jgi:hypothetical protein